jgi:hypothetical protein
MILANGTLSFYSFYPSFILCVLVLPSVPCRLQYQMCLGLMTIRRLSAVWATHALLFCRFTPYLSSLASSSRPTND